MYSPPPPQKTSHQPLNLLNARFGLEGVWMAFPVTYLAMLGLQTAYYRLVWRHKQIKRLV